ncbi:L,D-transpeptidase [Pontibacillus marinus]|uniref:L,D-transpeptidase n=1 Tax=Pontibacillus marinus TaxID=273164 RepID=UPI0018CDF6D9|nr:L,D-transpeptidase [Pontibacillus marinus]
MTALKEYEHLFEVKKNIFLSKEDPEFLKKYVKYRPKDGQKLYEYALEWKMKGHEKNYLTYLSKAARNGSFQAEKLLKQEGKHSSFKRVLPPQKATSMLGLYAWMTLLFLLFMILLLLCGIYLFQKFIHSYEVEHHFYKEEKTIIHDENNSPLLQPNSPQTYSETDIKQMVLKNAIMRYRQSNGSFPETNQRLIQDAPNNWLSFIPDDLIYTKNAGGFKLTADGTNPVTDEGIPLLELHLYPETHQLALTTTSGENLALYKIAKGEKPLPFTKSEVKMRVVEPNGGGGPLGTRGLALQNDYAIHGTDDPSSIGKSVSMGCVRMNNEDIETLFTYVSLGTPFSVQAGKPEPPMFKEGLPNLMNPNVLSNTSPQENYPFREFNWFH